jgi:hypothetical protein
MTFITLPDGDGHVFVFGSNVMGIHGAGAARQAREQYGAVVGVGEGRTGRCYALPTVGPAFVPLPLALIARKVARFLACAEEHPDLTFWLTPVGCGIAGYTPEEIAPLFRAAPSNVRLPDAFLRVLSPDRAPSAQET